MGDWTDRCFVRELSGVRIGVCSSFALIESTSGEASSIVRDIADAVTAASCSLYLESSCALRSLNSFSSNRPSSNNFLVCSKATFRLFRSKLSDSVFIMLEKNRGLSGNGNWIGRMHLNKFDKEW